MLKKVLMVGLCEAEKYHFLERICRLSFVNRERGSFFVSFSFLEENVKEKKNFPKTRLEIAKQKSPKTQGKN